MGLSCIAITVDFQVMAYTRNELLDIKQCVLARNVRLELSIWSTIKRAGICSTTSTHRGTGAEHHRHRTVIITHGRHGLSRSVESQLNTNNMTGICMENNILCVNDELSMMNCQSICNKTDEIVDYV